MCKHGAARLSFCSATLLGAGDFRRPCLPPRFLTFVGWRTLRAFSGWLSQSPVNLKQRWRVGTAELRRERARWHIPLWCFSLETPAPFC